MARGTGRVQKKSCSCRVSWELLCPSCEHGGQKPSVLAADTLQLRSGHPPGVFVLLETVPAAGSGGCVPRCPRQGLHHWARRVWVKGISFLSDTARADRQSWFPDVAKPTWVGHKWRGRDQQDGRSWLGAPATVSGINQVSPGTDCGCSLHWHHSGSRRVLVSLLTWAPAASALKQLLALVNPIFE